MTTLASLKKVVWQALAALGLILGVVGGLVMLSDRFLLQPRIAVEGQVSDFALPDSAKMGLQNIPATLQLIDRPEYQTQLHQPPGGSAASVESSGRLKGVQGLRDHWTKSGTLQQLRALDGYRSTGLFHVRNTGRKEQAGIRVETPYSGRYELSVAGRTRSSGALADTVAIGSLRPGEVAHLNVWSSGLQADLRKTGISLPDGPVAVEYPEEVTGLAAMLVRNLRDLLLGTLFLLIILLFYFGLR